MNKIDINKKYRTRAGEEPQCLHRAPEGWPNAYPWRGSVKGITYEWTDDGSIFGNHIEDDFDLIEVPELEFDWSCLPAWAEWITWGGGFGWIWWKNKPILGDVDVWFDQLAGLRGAIPSDFLPIYNGSDPAPIFKRPSKEGGEA